MLYCRASPVCVGGGGGGGGGEFCLLCTLANKSLRSVFAVRVVLTCSARLIVSEMRR